MLITCYKIKHNREKTEEYTLEGKIENERIESNFCMSYY